MKIIIAIDWLPDTVHTGICAAKHNGYYKETGLEVEFRQLNSSIRQSSVSEVLNDFADFAIVSSDFLVDHFISNLRSDLIAVASLVQNNINAFITLKRNSRTRPSKITDCLFATQEPALEAEILRQMILNDGGTGNFSTVILPKRGIWNSFISGYTDIIYVSTMWEVIHAQRKGIMLNVFQPDNYKVNSGYDYVLVTQRNNLDDTTYRFLKATELGYQFSVRNPELAVLNLQKEFTKDLPDDMDFLKASQKKISSNYLTIQNRWGIMQNDRWKQAVKWRRSQLVTSCHNEQADADNQFDATKLFTNEFL